MTERRLRAAIVCASEGPICGVADRLHDLLDNGWEADVLVEADASWPASELAALLPDVARLHVHPPPASVRGAAPRRALAIGLARAALRHPGVAARDLCGALTSLPSYLRAILLALAPDVVHFPALAVARRYARTTRAMGARVVVDLADEEADAVAFDPDRAVHELARVDGVLVETEALVELVAAARPGLVVAADWAGDRLLPTSVARLRSDGVLRILSVGPLTWAGGYEHAVHAVALLAERGIACHYRIVGRGVFADAIGFARHQLGVERLVDIVRPGDPGGLVEQLGWADVLLNAAVAARSPRFVLAAQAARVPVVTTELPPTGAGSALVVPKRDALALADCLAVLAEDHALRGRLAEAGRLARAAVPDSSGRPDSARRLYERVLERKSPSGRRSTRSRPA